MDIEANSKPWVIVVSRQFRALNEDDQLLFESLARRQLPVVWTYWDSDFDWGTAAVVIVRATWDYSRRLREFIAWLNFIETKTAVINPVQLMLWNADKRYLEDFRKAGIKIIDTRYFCELESALRHTQSQEQPFIVKPSISAGGRNTYRIQPGLPTSDLRKVLEEVLEFGELMIQPFVEHVKSAGEVSLAVIDGEITHAAIKFPKHGGFLVQPHHGGREAPNKITKEDREWASQVLDVCPQSPIYARLDFIQVAERSRLLVEAELIEPDLFLRFANNSADRFALAIQHRVNHA